MLYRCARDVSILVNNISTKWPSCLNNLNNLVDNAIFLGKEGSH